MKRGGSFDLVWLFFRYCYCFLRRVKGGNAAACAYMVRCSGGVLEYNSTAIKFDRGTEIRH
jgi:hypothetical protein